MGRPVGSTSGREPPGGYPGGRPRHWWLPREFHRGRRLLGISKQPRNTNHSCRFSLNVRDDDADLLRELAAITSLGRVVSIPARRTSRPQVAWLISAKSDCLRLVELLERHPMRGRKAGDLDIWASAVRWWVNSDATKTIRGRNWSPMIELKHRLHANKRLGGMCRVANDVAHADWAPYFAGLFTAEGALTLSINGASVIPRAQVTLRIDDLPLVKEIQRQTQTGRVYLSRRVHPSAAWCVRRGDELSRVVQLLDEGPLRGKKAREFSVWRRAVALYSHRSLPRGKVQALMPAFRTELAAVRAYPTSTS